MKYLLDIYLTTDIQIQQQIDLKARQIAHDLHRKRIDKERREKT